MPSTLNSTVFIIRSDKLANWQWQHLIVFFPFCHLASWWVFARFARYHLAWVARNWHDNTSLAVSIIEHHPVASLSVSLSIVLDILLLNRHIYHIDIKLSYLQHVIAYYASIIILVYTFKYDSCLAILCPLVIGIRYQMVVVMLYLDSCLWWDSRYESVLEGTTTLSYKRAHSVRIVFWYTLHHGLISVPWHIAVRCSVDLPPTIKSKHSNTMPMVHLWGNCANTTYAAVCSASHSGWCSDLVNMFLTK